MGTRNLSAAVVDGEYRIAKYCQWDGYPSGVGVGILNVLRNSDLNVLKERIRKNAGYIDKNKISDLYENLGINATDGWVSYEDGKRFANAHPLLNRDSDLSDVLQEHMKTDDKMIYTMSDLEFAKDSLFCEYAYVVDFDKNTFEVYKGFNTDSNDENGRFYESNEAELEKGHDGTVYYPVKHWHTWSLDELPSQDEFLATLDESDEVEDEDAA